MTLTDRRHALADAEARPARKNPLKYQVAIEKVFYVGADPCVRPGTGPTRRSAPACKRGPFENSNKTYLPHAMPALKFPEIVQKFATS
jgi:hypothetical protein